MAMKNGIINLFLLASVISLPVVDSFSQRAIVNPIGSQVSLNLRRISEPRVAPTRNPSSQYPLHNNYFGHRSKVPIGSSYGTTLLFNNKNNDLVTVEKEIVEEEETEIPMMSNLAIILPLLMVYISNQWSRSSIYYLVNFSNSETVTNFNAMNMDLNFSQAQYGALASVAFTALFAIASLFAGSLADRYDRKALTIGSCLAWTAAIGLTSISNDYNQVLAARIFMGLACAFATPSAYTLIRDLVPKDKAAFSNSLYGSGIYFGGALSSLSLLLNDSIGWRGTCGAIGAFGVASAATAAITLPTDPKLDEGKVIDVVDSSSSKEKEEENDKSLFSDSLEVLSSSRVQWLFGASFLRFCAGLCIGVWSAPYYKLAFPDDSTSYAVINAFIVGLCGVSSGVFGGWAADKSASFSNQFGFDNNAGRLAVPIVGSLLAVPAWWMTTHATTFDAAMFWLAVEYLVAENWFGAVVACLQSEVNKNQGGTALGMFTLTGAIGNLAPSALGIIYSNAILTDGIAEDSILSNLLGTGVCGFYFLSAVCFAVSASRSTRLKVE